MENPDDLPLTGTAGLLAQLSPEERSIPAIAWCLGHIAVQERRAWKIRMLEEVKFKCTQVMADLTRLNGLLGGSLRQRYAIRAQSRARDALADPSGENPYILAIYGQWLSVIEGSHEPGDWLELFRSSVFEVMNSELVDWCCGGYLC